MIYIKNGRDMQISYSEKRLVQNDNDFTTRTFNIPRIVDGIDISEYLFTLEIDPVNTTELSYFDYLEKTINETDISLTWNIKRHDTKDVGKLKCALKISDLNDKIFHSFMGEFEIVPTVDASIEGEALPTTSIDVLISEVEALRDVQISFEIDQGDPFTEDNEFIFDEGEV